VILQPTVKTRRLVVSASLAVAALVSACRLTVAQTTPVTATAPATAPAETQPATRPTFAYGPITAVINGDQLSRDEFQVALTQVAGPKVFDEIISVVLARQACQNAGIDVGQAQVKAQLDRILESLREQGVPESGLQQALGMLMQRQGITRYEFELLLQRNAYLAALSKDHGQVAQEDLDEAYKEETGRRYQVLDTQVDPAQAAQLRDLVEKQKKPLAEAARSLNLRVQEFVFSEFATEKQVPKSILDRAKQMKEGELSVMIPLESGSHMIYLEKIIPPTEIKPGEVPAFKEKLKVRLGQMAQDNWANQHLQTLLAKARIEFRDPVLAQMYQQIAAARAAATQAAASQSATQPATQAAPK
jgi:hypothetical protein